MIVASVGLVAPGFGGTTARIADDSLPVVEIRPNRLHRRRVEWDEPLLAALPQHADHSRAQVHVLHVEAGQLAETEPGRVEQFEDRAVSAPERRFLRRGAEQCVHLALAEMRWRPNLALRDRKSTRLNSSHANISYAVFCL